MTTAAAPRPSTAGLGGPVSASLEADLRSSVRRQGVVVWLDQAGHYGGFVDRLKALRDAGALPYEVHTFRGSHLALMMALNGVAAGTDKVPLVIHLPGFTEETVRQTPLFELYAAGVRYRKALDTLVTEAAAGRVRPDQIASFKAQPDMTLAGADAWLGALLDDAEGGIAAQLRVMEPTAVLDDLLTRGSWRDASANSMTRMPSGNVSLRGSACLAHGAIPRSRPRARAPRMWRSLPQAGLSAWSMCTI